MNNYFFRKGSAETRGLSWNKSIRFPESFHNTHRKLQWFWVVEVHCRKNTWPRSEKTIFQLIWNPINPAVSDRCWKTLYWNQDREIRWQENETRIFLKMVDYLFFTDSWTNSIFFKEPKKWPTNKAEELSLHQSSLVISIPGIKALFKIIPRTPLMKNSK